MSGPSGPEPGPLADEAARLIGAAQDWWHRTAGGPMGTRLATGSAECCWCPVCQLIAALRGDRPEIIDRLGETQSAVAGLLRALADAVGSGSTRPATGTPEDAADSAPARPRVQPIWLDEPGEVG